MDDSFDGENVHMAGANVNGNNQQGRGGNKNGPRLCHTCNQPGHMRANCPQNQNNGGGNNRNNYNNNGRQGQNANSGNRQNNQRAQGGRGGNGNGGNQNNNGQRAQNGRGDENNNNNNNAQQGQNGHGGNNNAQRGQNGRRGQNNDNNDNDNEPNPAGSQPDGPCYRHGPGHTNNVCNDSRNIWGPNHNGGNNGNQPQQQNRQQNQNQNQNQQRAPQENRHGNPRRNYVAAHDAEHIYCERCNRRDHITLRCPAPLMGARQIMTCSLCNTPGHTHTVCRNPAYCANCWGFGHSKEQCRRPRADHTFFHTNEDIDLVDADSVCSSGHSSTYSSPSQSRRSSVQTHYQLPQRNNGITKAYFANAHGDLVLEAPLDEISAQIAAIAAEKENARRHAIAAKCCGAHAKYSMKLLNDEIASGARFLGGVDPANPQIPLPLGMERTAALERLFQFWINDSSFVMAARFVREGWNFFRDPRVLDAIARSSQPVCHCCEKKGHILSATFTELVPGTDVLTVEDYDLWGPSVMFSCKCSVNGYSFMRAEDGRMDIQFM